MDGSLRDPKYQRWASFWDERDKEIRMALQEGNMNPDVVKIDHIIPGVADLSDDPIYWYDRCAAGYYGLNSITASQEGWDNPQP